MVNKEFAPALEREISAIDEVFVKAVALLVDVVDLVVVFAIDHDHDVRQRVRSVRIVRDGDPVKVSLRLDGWKRLLRRHRNTEQSQNEQQIYQLHMAATVFSIWVKRWSTCCCSVRKLLMFTR